MMGLSGKNITWLFAVVAVIPAKELRSFWPGSRRLTAEKGK
jgi:hypothetical protein